MEEIKRLISENKLEEAIRLLDAYLTEQPDPTMLGFSSEKLIIN